MSVVETCYQLSMTKVDVQSVKNWIVVGQLSRLLVIAMIVNLCLQHDSVMRVHLRQLVLVSNTAGGHAALYGARDTRWVNQRSRVWLIQTSRRLLICSGHLGNLATIHCIRSAEFTTHCCCMCSVMLLIGLLYPPLVADYDNMPSVVRIGLFCHSLVVKPSPQILAHFQLLQPTMASLNGVRDTFECWGTVTSIYSCSDVKIFYYFRCL